MNPLISSKLSGMARERREEEVVSADLLIEASLGNNNLNIFETRGKRVRVLGIDFQQTTQEYRNKRIRRLCELYPAPPFEWVFS
jgi:hypothetical protein